MVRICPSASPPPRLTAYNRVNDAKDSLKAAAGRVGPPLPSFILAGGGGAKRKSLGRALAFDLRGSECSVARQVLCENKEGVWFPSSSLVRQFETLHV